MTRCSAYADSSGGLAGGPELAFYTRWNAYCAKQTTGEWCTLALYVSALIRLYPLLSPVGCAALLAYCAGCAALLAVRASPWRDSFARWREWPMAAMRVGTFGLGLSIPGSVLTQQLLVAAGAPDGADGWADVATHLASLLILSGAAAMLHHGLVWRVRLGLAAAVSAAIAACALPSNEHICSTELMSSPAAQRGTHQAYALVSAVACLVPLPISRLVALDGAAECGALLAWCQLGVGLLCPLLYEAVTTARLFRAHQQQREAAGLEREQGAHAALFEFIDGLTLDGCALHTGLICWALLSCAFDWCSYLAGAAGPAAQQQLV